MIAGTVTSVDHANKKVTVRPAAGRQFDFSYDMIAVTAGAVTRAFPIPGFAENATGLKHIGEAIEVCDRLLAALDVASNLPAGQERKRLLTITSSSVDFAGVEGFGETSVFGYRTSAVLPKATFR